MRSLLLLPLLAVVSAAPSSSNVVEVVGTDYAFTLPATVAAGRTTFVFRNSGKQFHELNVFLLKKGATVDQVLELRRQGKPQLGVVIDAPVGVLFAEPGTTGAAKLVANLLPGRDYGIICIFSDSTGKLRHYDMGMYKTIRTTPAPPAKAAAEQVDSIIGVDYAYSKYPREISPGVHTLAFRNAGKQQHEFSIFLLKKGVTLDSLHAVDSRGGDVYQLIEEGGPGAVLYAPGGLAPAGNIVIDFLPGREYAFECGFQDDDKSPEHYKLGMFGSIKVKKR